MKKLFTFFAFIAIFSEMHAQSVKLRGQNAPEPVMINPVISHNAVKTSTFDEKDVAKGYVIEYHRLLDYSLVRVFPNPASNFFTIELPAGETFDVAVTDISGKVVLGEITVSEEKQVDCSSLPNGIYFISVTDDNSQVVFTEKLMVKN